jgi:hypothetical protein
MEQSIAGQQVMAEGPQASAEAAGMAGGQSAARLRRDRIKPPAPAGSACKSG